MTKTEFLAEYKSRLLQTFPWAQEEARLKRFMASVERTIRTTANSWSHTSDVATAIYREQGGKGKVTLKWLRALPD